MPYNIAFYVHHHGSGHIMRSLAIAERLKGSNISFLGSNLKAYQSLIPENIHCVHLPMDTANDSDNHARNRQVAGLHYAPLNIKGQLLRVNIITEFFRTHHDTLFVVDVSVEVAMLATLAGIPTVVVRQHGLRNDLPHQIAYQNAVGLLAPYGRGLHPEEEQWATDKTFFSGGFSRYPKSFGDDNIKSQSIAVLIGSGGTSISTLFLKHLALQCNNWHIDVIGKLDETYMLSSLTNLEYHGQQTNPAELLAKAKIVIGNAGHNTVMEVAAMTKRFIVIPEERPFAEQSVKADILSRMGYARVIQPQEIFTVNWPEVLEDVLIAGYDWGDTIDPMALEKTADYLKVKYLDCFANH